MEQKKGIKNKEEQEQLGPDQLKLALFPVGRPKGSFKEKKSKEFDSDQLKLALFPVGRPKGSFKDKKPKGFAPVQGLRFRVYHNVLCSEGTIISGTSDQYGRIMEPYVNDKNQWDIKPTGKTISAHH